MNILEYIFVLLTFAWYIFYGITFMNIIPRLYFKTFSFYYEMYVCLLLIAYFNPYTDIKLTKIKKQIVFTSALMLLFSIGVNNIVDTVSVHVNFIKNKTTHKW